MPRYPGFINGSNTGKSKASTQERTVNLYVEPVTSTTVKSEAVLYRIPGERIFSAQSAIAPGSPGRRIEEHAGRVFAVIGSEFLEIVAGGGRITLGTVALDTKPATISYNGEGGGLLYITSGQLGYTFDLPTSTFAAGPPIGVNTSGVMLDGYFVVLDASISAFSQSNLYANPTNGITFDGLAFAQRSIESDPWVQILVHDRNLYLLGTQTSEVWFNDGSFPLTFAAHPSGLIKYGCAAPWSAVSLGDAAMWLAATKQGYGQVVMCQGFQAKVVSTYELEAEIQGYGYVGDARGFGYQVEGHLFYILTFPSANKTWTLDVTTGKWTERGEWVPEQADYVAWRPVFHAAAFGEHLFLDLTGGDVIALDPMSHTHASGRAIRWLRQAPTLFDGQRWIKYREFRLIVQAGVGLATGQGSDPLVELHVSDDGGETFYVAGSRTMGKQGARTAELFWNRMGQAQDRGFRVVGSDPVFTCIIDAYVEADQ